MFEPFSLSKAINSRQTAEMNQLKINAIQSDIQKKREIKSLAQISTVPTYGDYEQEQMFPSEAPIEGLKQETGQRYDPQTNVKNLQEQGFTDEAAKLSEQIGKMNETERDELSYKNTEVSKLLAGVKDEATYYDRQQVALDRGLITEDETVPYSPENVQMMINSGRKIEDILGTKSRGGYTTLTDVVIDGKTWKVPFDHRTGKYKWDEKQMLSPKTPSQQAAVAGGKKGAAVEAKARTEAKIDLPKVRSNAKQLKSIVRKVLEHPGFSGVVGAPSISKLSQYVGGTEAAGFKALYDQLGGKQFSQAYETLKGGGQITEIEGEKATNALSTMRTSVSEEEFIEAAETFILEIDRLTGIAEQRAATNKAASKGGWSIREK